MINKELETYVEKEIIPRYRHFDSAHSEEHVRTVIKNALELAKRYDVDENMIYAAAAYHDTGVVEGRELHHIVSGRIIRADKELLRWFTPEQIETIAQAAEDHRASSDRKPRGIYGLIIAEADRDIDPLKVIRRTVQFGFCKHPELDREGQWQRTVEHLMEKYAEGGYLKLWIPESDNAAKLAELRTIIKDTEKLRELFDREYQRLRVLDFLQKNGIPYEIYEHPPLFTIEEALSYWGRIPECTHCKNLFMRNHKGNRHYLISFECHKQMDIHGLEHALHQGKLSFASPERMMRCLGLRPGSVSPFGLIEDIDLSGADPKELFENGHRVKFYLDSELMKSERLSFHPCDNTASVVVTKDDFLRFLELWGGEWELLAV